MDEDEATDRVGENATGAGAASDAGDAATFEAFYVAEYAAAVRLAYVLLGRRALAEEEVQEAFLAAHRRWDRLRSYDDAAAWLRRVVVNRCLSALRRRTTELRLATRLREQRPPTSTTGDPGADVDPAADRLWAAVRALPRRQAEVLALAFVEDRSVADIARVLDCGEATVRTHLRRGRLAVADALALPEGDDR